MNRNCRRRPVAKCFFRRALGPEERCENDATWISAHCLPPVNDFVWCDEHHFKSDIRIEETEDEHEKTG